MHHFFIILITLILYACSPNTEVNFDPSASDERDYWTYSDTFVSGSFESSSTTMLQHFKVTNTDPLKLNVSVDYINLNVNGETVINSTESKAIEDSDKHLAALFNQGFTLTIDTTSGQLVDFKGNDKATWQKVLNHGGQRVVNMLKKNVLSPRVIQTIPAKVGTKISLPSFAGKSASLEVIKVTDKKVYSRLTSGETDKNTKLIGEMVLNREGGWLEKLVMVLENTLSLYGKEYKTHTRFVMMPKEQPIIFNFNYSGDGSSWYGYKYMLENKEPLKVTKGSELLPFDTGAFTLNDNMDIELYIPLQLSPRHNRGSIKSRNIEVFDTQGSLMDIELAYSQTKIPHDGESINQQAFKVVGWNNQIEQKKIGHINATIDYYPTHYFSKTINWTGKKQTFDIHGMKVTVTPDKKDPSIITVSNYPANDRQYLRAYFGNYDDIQTRNGNGAASQEWLNLGDRIMLRRLTMLNDAQFKLSTLPKDIIFYLSETADSPSFSKSMEFIPPHQYISNPKKPPLEQIKLKIFASNTHNDAKNISEFEVAYVNNQYDYILLPSDWAAICQLNIISNNKVNGHTLKWIAEEDNDYNQLGSVYYNLSTEDNEEQFFKNISVTSQLQCDGTPSWKNIDYQPNIKTPWLVSLKKLGNIDMQQTVSEFISQYRFLNSDAEPLVVLRHDGTFINEPQTTKLGDIILSDEQALNVAGKVKSVKKRVIIGPLQNRQWTHHYPEY